MLQVTPEPNTLLSGAGPAALTGLNIIHKHLTGQEGTKQHMKVTGIIMECNPFHEGHAYILQEARRLTQADYIVVAMSGDYVQRGEPALYDKYIRAEEILRAGADLVLEIPLFAACGSAEYFARGGIALLDKLGIVTDLCFGSESGDLDNILRCAGALAGAEDGPPSEKTARYRSVLQEGLKSGMTFPAARSAALEDTFIKEGETLSYPSVPNDVLAVEYCRALMLLGSDIRPHAIGRINVPSATQYRKSLLQDRAGIPAGRTASGRGADDSLPLSDNRSRHTDACAPDTDFTIRTPEQFLSQSTVSQIPLVPLGADDFSECLMYALKMHEHELETYADVSEDLAARIRKNLGSYRGFTDFCDLINTRNLTRTRVSRCLLHILLQIRKERLHALQSAGIVLYLRPLAFRRAASPLLSAISQNASVPFLSRLSDAKSHLAPKAFSFLEEEMRAEDLYCMTLSSVSRGLAPEEPPVLPVPGAMQRRLPVFRTVEDLSGTQ